MDVYVCFGLEPQYSFIVLPTPFRLALGSAGRWLLCPFPHHCGFCWLGTARCSRLIAYVPSWAWRQLLSSYWKSAQETEVRVPVAVLPVDCLPVQTERLFPPERSCCSHPACRVSQRSFHSCRERGRGTVHPQQALDWDCRIAFIEFC